MLLLEKAFAKILGSYGLLKGGFSRFPFTALTGNDCVEYAWQDDGFVLRNTSGTKEYNTATETEAESDRDAPQALLLDGMYNVLSHGLKNDIIATVFTTTMACLTSYDHTKCLHYLRRSLLVQMRNPWGRAGEWSGPYSDHDAATNGWKPDQGFVLDTLGLGKKGVENATEDDGLFWMPLEDLAKHAHGLFCLCAVSDSMASMRLDMHEDLGECGPCYGCAEEGAPSVCNVRERRPYGALNNVRRPRWSMLSRKATPSETF